jgi:hypothetical protein
MKNPLVSMNFECLQFLVKKAIHSKLLPFTLFKHFTPGIHRSGKNISEELRVVIKRARDETSLPYSFMSLCRINNGRDSHAPQLFPTRKPSIDQKERTSCSKQRDRKNASVKRRETKCFQLSPLTTTIHNIFFGISIERLENQ